MKTYTLMQSKRTLVWLLTLSLFLPAGLTFANDLSLLTFGTGKTQVRLYSDYFCGACSKLEPQLDAVLPDLVKNNKVTLVFVDTPTHRQSALFARYFLYAMNEKKELRHALKVRSLLFEAAKTGVREQAKLEELLAAKGIKFKTFDVVPVFKTLEGYIRDEKVSHTPTVAIASAERKESHQGSDPIIKALGAIK